MPMSCDVNYAQIDKVEIRLIRNQVLCCDLRDHQVALRVVEVLSEVGEIERARRCQIATMLPIVDKSRPPLHGVSGFSDARHRAHHRHPCVGRDPVP